MSSGRPSQRIWTAPPRLASDSGFADTGGLAAAQAAAYRPSGAAGTECRSERAVGVRCGRRSKAREDKRREVVTPDFSNLVVHLTKDGPPWFADDKHLGRNYDQIRTQSALDRLCRILDEQRVRSSHMPWTKLKASCFTECTWPGLLVHTRSYSKYGVVFEKAFLFQHRGGPALYLPQHLFEAQQAHVSASLPFARELYRFMTPFRPAYADAAYQAAHWQPGDGPCDHTSEREWRVPGDLVFTYSDVKLVLLGANADLARLPASAVAGIGGDRLVAVDSYEKLEELWPLHQLP